MEITAEKIMQQLSAGTQVAGVIAVFGEEGYYKDKIAAALPRAVFGDAAPEDREITVFECDTDIKEISAAVNTYPFFSGRSLVIIKDEKLWGGKDGGEKRKQQQEELAELLADVPEHCQVLLLGEKIDKRGKLYKSLLKTAAMVECKSLKSYQLKPWLDEQAALRGCRFDYEASQTIMEYLSVTDNAPLLLLEQEIEKLSVYAGERKIWTKDDIEQTFAALPEVSRFALLNAIAEKKLGAQSKDWSTGFLNADCAHAFRADLRNENVNNAEHRSGNQRSLEHFTCNIGLLCKAGITDNPDRKRRENQRGDRVKRVVAIKDPLDNCHHRSRIGSGGSLRFAHRSDEALNNKDHQRQNQQRRKNLADTIHKLGRRRSKPTGYA